ncbi:mannosyltransferase [Algibacter sp. L1A34]|uniref:mannosyltransferase n=1 Tax=Algibacter sp. L1A34 TaxID=2686365 RepID=UPI00131E4695|nr:mannosyltransferase [Algibacter sp. L1A34]
MFMNSTFLKLNKQSLLLAILSVLLYWAFAYNLVRTDYLKLIGLYVTLFALFYRLVSTFKDDLKLLTYLAFGFRCVFILAIPNLSQDFYRFIWDGRMIFAGFNPYLFTPESFINSEQSPIAQAEALYTGMGVLNGSHFTNYPPINQLCFFIASVFAGKSILGSVVVFKFLIIAADFGTFFYGSKLLKRLDIPVYNIFWYILNPFIIIELTGNLHFEGVMIFFLIWSLYLLHCGKWKFAAVILALSITVKLIPLIFLALFFKWFLFNKHKTNNEKPNLLAGLWKLVGFYSITLLTTLLLFAPFLSAEFFNNYAKTVGLWFQNFEFNASLYYIAREVGYTFRGYNEIGIIGKVTPILVVLFILIITFFRKNKTMVELISAMLLVLSFYYFTATTIHPWYIATLLILSVFTKYKFPLVWSFVIILSYLAYVNIDKADKSENLWVIALEYAVVYAVFIWEVFLKKTDKRLSVSSKKISTTI